MKVQTDEADVLARVIRWTSADERIRAVVLTSSRVVSGAPRDPLSDYDVVLLVTEPEAFAESDEWLHGFGGPLLVVRDSEAELGLTRHNCMVLYDDGTKVDFTIQPLDLLARIRATGKLPDDFDLGYQVLLDKDDLTRDLPAPTFTAHIPAKPSRAEYRNLIQECWWVAAYVARYLRRGDVYAAKVICDYELKHLLVRRLLEWRIELDHDWSLKPGFFGRGLERHLPAEIWARFAATYVGTDPTANWTALSDTMDLVRDVATEVGQALGYPYPHDLDTQMRDYLEQIRRVVLRREA